MAVEVHPYLVDAQSPCTSILSILFWIPAVIRCHLPGAYINNPPGKNEPVFPDRYTTISYTSYTQNIFSSLLFFSSDPGRYPQLI